jgi:DNA ligase-associated metallophosphoesterase
VSDSGEGDVEIRVRGETLTLLPERAVFWGDRGTLLVADPHFGKAATFRALGVPVPSGTTGDALARLGSAVSRTSATRVIFLGDLLHARPGRSQGMFDALGSWLRSRPDVEVVLVRGNHDRHAGDPPDDLGIRCVNAPHEMSPFVLTHHPRADPAGYVLAGHVHPGVRLYGSGRQRERLPCFVIAEDYAVLPAFGDFTGLADDDPPEGAAVYAIAGDSVIGFK